MVVFLGWRAGLPRNAGAATRLGFSPSVSRHVTGLTSLSRVLLHITRGYAARIAEGQEVEEKRAARRELFRKNMISRFGPRYDEVDNILVLLYEEAVQNGYPASYTEFLVGYHSKNRKDQSCRLVSTLNLEKGLAQEQFIHLVPVNRPETPKGISVRWSGHVVYGRKHLGASHLNQKLGAEDRFLCPYFDRQAGLLRFRRRDGKDAKWSVDLIYSAHKGSSWRPFLLLANAEGYLKHCPDGYLRTLDHEKLLNEGYYLRSPIEKYGRVQLHPKEFQNKPAVRFALSPHKSQLFPGQTHFRGFPYVDKDDKLRLWNVDSKRDIRFRPSTRDGTGYSESFSAVIIKRLNPKFFEFAQRLGYWNSI